MVSINQITFLLWQLLYIIMATIIAADKSGSPGKTSNSSKGILVMVWVLRFLLFCYIGYCMSPANKIKLEFSYWFVVFISLTQFISAILIWVKAQEITCESRKVRDIAVAIPIFDLMIIVIMYLLKAFTFDGTSNVTQPPGDSAQPPGDGTQPSGDATV